MTLALLVCAGKSKQVLSDDERQMLEEAVEANFLFANMNDTERNTVFEAMQKVPVKVRCLCCHTCARLKQQGVANWCCHAFLNHL
jgi:hypothetical protein